MVIQIFENILTIFKKMFDGINTPRYINKMGTDSPYMIVALSNLSPNTNPFIISTHLVVGVSENKLKNKSLLNKKTKNKIKINGKNLNIWSLIFERNLR
jgi:hypothetical protein